MAALYGAVAVVLDQFQEDAFLNGKDKSILTLRGWTVPDSRSTEDPDPARIWSGNVMEQKNPGSTDLRMACICFLSVVRRCFLDTDLPLILTPVRCYWANTTAGMRPWALSLAETLLPVHSLGMARITCYAETGGDDESENDLGFNIAVLRRPAGINVWEGVCCRHVLPSPFYGVGWPFTPSVSHGMTLGPALITVFKIQKYVWYIFLNSKQI